MEVAIAALADGVDTVRLAGLELFACLEPPDLNARLLQCLKDIWFWREGSDMMLRLLNSRFLFKRPVQKGTPADNECLHVLAEGTMGGQNGDLLLGEVSRLRNP